MLESDEPLWRLEILRPQPRVMRGGEETTLGARGGIALAVVLYLIMTRGDATERTELIQIFQAMAGGGLGRDHLRRIVHDLRQVFGADAITGVERLQWNLPVSVDAEELLGLTPETMQDDCLSVYQAEFLASWDKLKHAGGFWRWARERRDQFRRHALFLLDQRARGAAESREWERVRAIGARISALWPEREEGYVWEIGALEQLAQLASACERYLDATRALTGQGASSGSPLRELGERVQLRYEGEMNRRAAEPLRIHENALTASGRDDGSLTGVKPEVRSPIESPISAKQGETGMPPQPAATPVDDGSNRADSDTHPAPAASPPPANAAVEASAPAHLRSPSPHARRSALVSLPVRHWLAGITAGLVALLAILVLVTRPGTRFGRGDRETSGVGPICRNGTGRGALVREVYHAGEGVDAGAVFTKSWYLLNDGQCSWAPDFVVVRQSPRKGSGTRFIVDAETVRLGRNVAPGDSVVVRIRMRAPDLHGFVRERWSLFDATNSTVNVEGSPYLPVALIVRKHPVPLCRPEEVAAELIATNHENRQAVPVGSEFTATWTLINPRLCTWPIETRLRRKKSRDGVLIGSIPAVSAGDVLPGEMITLRVPMRAPARTGIFGEEWELTAIDGEAQPISGAPSVWIRIQSASPGETAQLRAPRCGPGQAVASFQSETIRDYMALPPDQPFEKTWTLLNAGGCRWEAPMKLRLDRSTGARMSLVDEVPVEGMVMPGNTYTFTVPSRTPLQPGTYSEYWRLTGPGGKGVPIPNNDEVWVTIRVR